MEKRTKKKGKHFKVLKKKYRIIIFFLTIVLILSLMYILKQLSDKEKVKEESNLLSSIEIEENKITDEKTRRMLQVEELEKENSDIVGWIEIKNSNINYPVLQSSDNDFYMTHNYKKEEAKDLFRYL